MARNRGLPPDISPNGVDVGFRVARAVGWTLVALVALGFVAIMSGPVYAIASFIWRYSSWSRSLPSPL